MGLYLSPKVHEFTHRRTPTLRVYAHGMSYAWPSQTRNSYGRGGMYSAPMRGRGGHGSTYKPLNTTGPTPARQKAEVEDDMHPGLRMEQEHGAVGYQRPSAKTEEGRHVQN